MYFYFVYGFKNQNQKFLWLHKTFVSCFCLWFWFRTREFFITWQEVCSYCFIYSYKIHNRVLSTKIMALKKLLENSLDESWKLKNMFNGKLGCLMKSLLSQNFYQTMSDLLKTLILLPGYSLNTLSKPWKINVFWKQKKATTSCKKFWDNSVKDNLLKFSVKPSVLVF